MKKSKYLNKDDVSLIIVAILILALPILIFLASQKQIFSPKANTRPGCNLNLIPAQGGSVDLNGDGEINSFDWVCMKSGGADNGF